MRNCWSALKLARTCTKLFQQARTKLFATPILVANGFTVTTLAKILAATRSTRLETATETAKETNTLVIAPCLAELVTSTSTPARWIPSASGTILAPRALLAAKIKPSSTAQLPRAPSSLALAELPAPTSTEMVQPATTTPTIAARGPAFRHVFPTAPSTPETTLPPAMP